jgi:hypothetical protein
MPAQMLAQTRPGARGALLFHAALPLSEFGGSWPQGAPAPDPLHRGRPVGGGRPSSRREIIANVEGAELFRYPGDRHLFADNSVSDYEPESATLLKQRALSFLERVE